MALLELEHQETSDLPSVGAEGLNDIQRIAAPEPGIYYDMPAEHYHKIDAVSASQLKIMRRSPAHLRVYQFGPHKETEAMSIGTAVHARVLEPLKFSREFVIMPRFDKRTKLGKEAAANFEIENLGKTVIDQECASMCEAIYDSLMANPFARQLLEAPGAAEVSLFWKDSETGLPCKARLDKLASIGDEHVALDIKTAQSAEISEFGKQVYSLGYHLQAGFYLDAATQLLSKDHNDFLFLPCEKEAPYAHAIYRPDDQAIELGRTENRRLLALWKECEKKNEWPSYGNEIQSLSLPAWAYR